MQSVVDANQNRNAVLVEANVTEQAR